MSPELVLVSLSSIHCLGRRLTVAFVRCAGVGHRCFRFYRLSRRLATLAKGLSRSRVLRSITLLSPPSTHHRSPPIFFFSLVRAGKFEAVKASYIKYGDRVDIAVIDDLITGDFTDVLKGVHAVIHVATPLPGRQDLQATIDVSTRHFTSRHMSI